MVSEGLPSRANTMVPLYCAPSYRFCICLVVCTTEQFSMFFLYVFVGVQAGIFIFFGLVVLYQLFSGGFDSV